MKIGEQMVTALVGLDIFFCLSFRPCHLSLCLARPPQLFRLPRKNMHKTVRKEVFSWPRLRWRQKPIGAKLDSSFLQGSYWNAN